MNEEEQQTLEGEEEGKSEDGVRGHKPCLSVGNGFVWDIPDNSAAVDSSDSECEDIAKVSLITAKSLLCRSHFEGDCYHNKLYRFFGLCSTFQRAGLALLVMPNPKCSNSLRYKNSIWKNSFVKKWEL